MHSEEAVLRAVIVEAKQIYTEQEPGKVKYYTSMFKVDLLLQLRFKFLSFTTVTYFT